MEGEKDTIAQQQEAMNVEEKAFVKKQGSETNSMACNSKKPHSKRFETGVQLKSTRWSVKWRLLNT
ncbi:hypothetical protein F442_22760 [Phytophthora nicotianae P10297]|uniref:Uncharacterized protein n=1 Tax=Phytophthora nicotianae P10297 TaxID=1317064 RepID=W2XYL9_PHYNI|nr:hypothetical protein F442_22760 [Phytophthora nicotianae P10297]